MREKKSKRRDPLFEKRLMRYMKRKLVLLFVAIILAFLFLILRVTYIYARKGDEYARNVLSQQNYSSETIQYKRGDILDRNGTVLATDQRVYNVILDTYLMMHTEKEGKEGDEVREKSLRYTKETLEQYFGISGEVVDAILAENPNSLYNILARNLTYDEVKEFKELEKKITEVKSKGYQDEEYDKYYYIKGIWLEEGYKRVYPNNSLACDVIGFTVDGNIGNSGIEASYNKILNGVSGREFGYQDEDVTLQRTVIEPENGQTVVSTIDIQVQSIVEQKIHDFNNAHQSGSKLGSKNTAVIVMNPQNGEILAEASYPDYDLNSPRDLSAYYSEGQIAAMSDQEKVDALNSLWNNFCVVETYEPGSTIKPFTVASALEDGTLDGSETFYCGGSLHVGDYEVHCSNRNGHGTLTLKQAVEQSCNVALMTISLKMGAEEFARTQRMFGFGKSTGIDLPGESTDTGLLYSAESMDQASLATNAFGQNFTATMTQMAASFSSLINGGNYYKPHVVKKILDENGNVIQDINPVLLRSTVSKETADIVKDAMRGVVTEGTGRIAQIEGYDVGGKTGTAEKLPRGNGKYLVSFIGYAPQEHPEVVVYVVIDEPNVGNQANSALATQLATDIMSEIFPYLGITKVQ
ncbi:MAG: penicillin-binding protein 2 [Lachnospiraceae bacterium]|jgi:stage V sporulation protein D (sporulation-specific penicillin-binding protein)|nr:penicillin-binding protein 2 [Lachnospiraceae bacterium]